MRPPVPTFVRLLAALEDLAAQEAVLLAGEDYAGVRATQERAAPLIVALARQGIAAVTPAVRPRLDALLVRRRECQRVLDARIPSVREALQGMQDSQRRIARVAPAYGGQAPMVTLPQLRAQG